MIVKENKLKKERNKLMSIPKRYVICVILFFCMWCATSYSVDSIYQSYQEIQNSYSLILSTSQLNSSVLSMETSARGYLLYYDKNSLKAYENSKYTIHADLVNSFSLAKNDSETTFRLRAIQKNVNGYKTKADKLISRMSPNLENNQKIVEGNFKKRSNFISKINVDADQIMSDQTAKIERTIANNKIKKLLINIMLFIVSFISIWMMLSQAKKMNEIVFENSVLTDGLLEEISSEKSNDK